MIREGGEPEKLANPGFQKGDRGVSVADLEGTRGAHC